jgi:diamine N-acetyltransferase
MEVRLREIAYEHFHAVIDLEIEKEQELNLPSNLYSIAEASFSPSCFTRAIWFGEKIVGFLMYRFGEDADDQHECIIWRFMIDRQYQNKGIGNAAMALLLQEIKENGRCRSVEIYYDNNNVAARKLYTGYGFIPTGTRDDGDVIAVLAV